MPSPDSGLTTAILVNDHHHPTSTMMSSAVNSGNSSSGPQAPPSQQSPHQMLPTTDDDDGNHAGAQSSYHYYTKTRASMELDNDPYDTHQDDDDENPSCANAPASLCGCGCLDTIVSRALAWDMMARSMIGMSSVYLGPALLDLAGDQEKVWGTSPGALLTNLAAVSGLLGCIVLPWAGCIMDHTRYRKAVGTASAIVLVVLKGLEIGLLRPTTWRWLLPMQVVLAVAFNIHLMAVYAYVSELSTDPSVQAGYNSAFGIVLYLASLGLLVGVLIGSALWVTADDSRTAQMALAITTVACFVGFGRAWTTGFPERPALHAIPPHQTIWTAGFVKLAKTVRTMWSDRATTTGPALSVLAAVAFGEAARGALISVSTTVMKVTLQMDADESELLLLLLLLLLYEPILFYFFVCCCGLAIAFFSSFFL
jgi:hypothetical protein